MIARSFFLKLIIVIKTIIEVSNWPIPILHYFRKRKKEDIVTFRNGTKCIIRNRSDATTFFENFFLKPYTDTKGFFIKENDTILDVGAHIGFFTIYSAKQAPKGKVYAFEPSRNSFNVLQRHIEMNKLENVISENYGVLKNSGSATLFVDESFAIGNSMFSNDSLLSRESVETISLPDILNKYKIRKIDLLKLDCEGAEFEIILNLSKDDLAKIVKIAAEIHYNIGNYHIDDLVKFLKVNNFDVEYKYLLAGFNTSMPTLYAVNREYLNNQ